MHTHFDGQLSTRDAKQHIRHPFEVPPGAGEVEIAFHFAPVHVRGYSNLLTLTLFDARGENPDGFRGAGHRDGDPGADGVSTHTVHLSATSATPGYIPGPLPAGTWTLEIDTHMIMPGPPVRYSLDIVTGEAGPEAGLSGLAAGPVSSSTWPGSPADGPGWYRGDLHTHTHHSDAHGFSVAELAGAAAGAGLDFLFLTDHNTTSGLASWPASSPVVLGHGLELTTYWGHAVCLGTGRWVDWRVAPGSGGMARAMAEVEAAGGIFVIAHPGSVGDPACTGCAWRFGELMPDGASFVEVWNGPWAGDSGNEAALALWYDWLNQGHRLTATAGTDAHGAGAYAPGGTEGLPGFTVIHAAACTQQHLLDGLRHGRCYLSAGPHLDLTCRTPDGAVWTLGDTVPTPATLSLSWDSPASAQGRLLANGRLLDTWAIEGPGRRTWPLSQGDADWLVVEIRDAAGHMLALTNPIFCAV